MTAFPFDNNGVMIISHNALIHALNDYSAFRGVPAHTQSTQLRTLFFECPKNKIALNRGKCNKNMPHPGYVFIYQLVSSNHPKYADFAIILNQSNMILTVLHFCFGSK